MYSLKISRMGISSSTPNVTLDSEVVPKTFSANHRPLRILQVNTADQGGGSMGSSRDLLQAYRVRGHKSWLAVGKKYSSDPDIFEIPKLVQSNGWSRFCWQLHDFLGSSPDRVSALGRLQTGLRMLANLRPRIERKLGIEDFNYPGTWRLLQLPPQKPDLVHAHNLHSRYFDLGYLEYLSGIVPVILNLRDMWLLTGHCAYSMGCSRWKSGCGRCPDLSIYPAVQRDATAFNWRRKKRIYRASKLHIVTPSSWLLEQAKASMLKGIEYRVIPNGIDLEVFRPGSKGRARQELDLPADAKIVLLIAHSRFKDLSTMESALEQLELSSGSNMLFICLGRYEEEKLLGRGRIVYREFVKSRGRMATYYQAADVYIHAAKAEAFGKTIIEAQACGVPVVATAVGGIGEIVRDSVDGFLVPPSDWCGMANAIERLLENPDLHLAIADAGRKNVAARYGLDTQAESFLSWYHEILQTWGSELFNGAQSF